MLTCTHNLMKRNHVSLLVQQDFKAAVTFLYFGCRHKNVDYLHKEQLGM